MTSVPIVQPVPDLVSRLADEVERLRADLDAAAYRAGRQQSRTATAQAERDEALAAVERVRALAEDPPRLGE